MRMPTKIISVRLTKDAKTTTGEIRVQFWDHRERTIRALKLGGLCWAAAVLSVALPIAHFVLVPAFFLAGPIVAYLILKQESVVLGGQGTCPNCAATFTIARAPYRFPISDLCTGCRTNVSIELDQTVQME